MRYIYYVLISMILFGCRSLETEKLIEFSEQTEPAGVLYSLPMTKLDLAASWRVTKCGPDGVTIKSSLKVTPGQIPDPNEVRVLDYRDLGGLTSTSSLKIELTEDGMLKGINASRDDKTAEIVTSFVGSAVKIAALASGIPTFPAAGEVFAIIPAAPTQTRVICRPATKAAVESVKLHQKSVAAATQTLAASTVRVSNAATVVAGTKKPTKDARRELEVAIAENLSLQSNLAKAQKRLQAILGSLTVSASTGWAGAGTLKSAESSLTDRTTIKLPKSKISKLLVEGEVPKKDNKGPQTLTSLASDNGQVVEIYAISKLTATACKNKCEVEKTTKKQEADGGIAYRFSAPGHVFGCLKRHFDEKTSCANVGKGKKLFDKTISIAQLGRIAVLPLDTGAFQSNTLDVSFSKTGQPTSITFKDESVELQKVAGILESAVEQVTAFRDARRNADLEAIKRRTAEVQALNELQTAISAGAPDEPQDPLDAELELLGAQTEIAQARLGLLLAQQALRDAEAEN